MSIPPGQIRSQLNQSSSISQEETLGIDQLTGSMSLGDDKLTVAPSSTHLTLSHHNSLTDSEHGIEPHGIEAPSTPRFRADQIAVKTSGRWAKLKGTLAGLISGVAVGGGVAAGMVIGGVIGSAIPIPIVGTVSGMIVGAVIGALSGVVTGLATGGATYSHLAMRTTSRYLDGAKSHFNQVNRTFSSDGKNRLESVTPRQWKSLLALSGKTYGTREDRQTIRNALYERVATEGLAAASRLKKNVVNVPTINSNEVPNRDARKNMQGAIVKMTLQRGPRAALQFKRELIAVAGSTDLSQRSPNSLLNQRLDEEAQSNRVRVPMLDNQLLFPAVPLATDSERLKGAVARLDENAQSSKLMTAIRSLTAQHTDALLEDSFWQAQVTGSGVQAPRFMIENIAPQIALQVLQRASENGVLSRKDLDDFNKSLNPTGLPVDNAHLLPDQLIGQQMDEQLKLQMVNTIKTVYATAAPESNNFLQAMVPNMNLDTPRQKQLDRLFENNSNGADARIQQLQSTVSDIQDDFAQAITNTMKTTFALAD